VNKKDITPRNEKGKLHGYCESYWDNGQLCWKGVIVNGKMYGYHEAYSHDGRVYGDFAGYFVENEKASNGNKEGYCIIWYKAVLV